MLVLSLANPNILLLKKDLDGVDCLEYRLDLMPSFEFKRPLKPFIFTLRHIAHGGKYSGSIDELCQLIFNYCQHKPDFLDLDIRLPQALFTRIRQHFPHIKIIASYHQFEVDINQLKSYLDKDVDCDVLKLAMHCETAIDVLHLLQLKSKRPLSLIPMGEKASFGRVLGKIIGNTLDYVALNLEQQTATGQLTLDEMINIYNYHHLNQNSKIYALLANPVTHSVGHLFHNYHFQRKQRNAVYVKIEQDKQGLTELLQLMLEFPFQGLSLSMPLKQEVYKSQIINTLVRKDESWLAYNTDGQAAVKLLELKPGMTVLILGNGGAAKGIMQECLKHGVVVFYLARQQGDYTFEDDIPDFDVLINTLANTAYSDRPWFYTKLNRLVCNAKKRLDVIYHEITAFQEICIKHELHFVTGLDMFETQAELQQELWKSN